MDNKVNRVRLNQIPVLHVKGTYAAVGFAIGRQFRYQIEDTMRNSESFNEDFLPAYETESGRRIYETTLETCKKRFPNYVNELEGMAEGAKIPFYKLFLLHLEVSLSDAKNEETGCSSILCNGKDLIIGHTEDAPVELLNNVFIVSAEIVDENGAKLEKFSSLTYAGCLPGYTMGFNEHGFVHTINTLCPLQTRPGKTPRSFIARALLAARNLDEVMSILRNKGDGISDAFSVNAHFVHDNNADGPMMYNIEVCPDPDPESNESLVDMIVVKPGESYAHCNKFLRIQAEEVPRAFVVSSHRHEAIAKHPKSNGIETVKEILSDRTDPEYPVYRLGDKKTDTAATVAVGIFDIRKREWRVYIDQPAVSSPVAILPLYF